MKVIVGLGNPGPKYEFTRHNIGFLTIDQLAQKLNIEVKQSKFKALYGETRIGQEKVILLKPMTYMNLSGESVNEVLRFYNCEIDDVLIIYDDLDLPAGKMKLRMQGGAGGHNGIKSIIQHLGTQQFKRIKMGIGRPVNEDVVSYVLGTFSKEEQETLQEMLPKAADACVSFVEEEDFSKVMNNYNV